MGRPICEAVQRIVIRMSAKFRPKDIATHTGVSKRQIEYILSYFEQTGTIRTRENKKPSLRRGLSPEDVKVRYLCPKSTSSVLAEQSLLHLITVPAGQGP
jgi:hypothetical protein